MDSQTKSIDGQRLPGADWLQGQRQYDDPVPALLHNPESWSGYLTWRSWQLGLRPAVEKLHTSRPVPGWVSIERAALEHNLLAMAAHTLLLVSEAGLYLHWHGTRQSSRRVA